MMAPRMLYDDGGFQPPYGSRDGNFTRGFGYPSDIRPVGYGFGHEI
jgi:hypothetical protein